MADLNPLIRVRRHVVDQKQKFLAELYRQSEELARQKKALEDQLAQERENLKNMGAEMLIYFGPYSDAVEGRIEDIIESITKLEIRINIAREDMREAFAELKKVEITQERREDEAQAVLDKKESQDLDEIGIEIHRRRGNEE